MTVVMKVRDVMNRDVTKVNARTDVSTATKIMVEKGVRCAVVVDDNGKPLGIVTEGSIARKVVKDCKDPSKIKVSEIMSSPLKTIPADATLREASNKLLEEGVNQLYVEENGEIVGLITEHRILKAINEVVLTLISI